MLPISTTRSCSRTFPYDVEPSGTPPTTCANGSQSRRTYSNQSWNASRLSFARIENQRNVRSSCAASHSGSS